MFSPKQRLNGLFTHIKRIKTLSGAEQESLNSEVVSLVELLERGIAAGVKT